MIRSNNKNLCREAELYYFDFIEDNLEEIPRDLFDHLKYCNLCQKKIKELRCKVSKVDIDLNEQLQQKKVVDFLFEQCKFAGKEVTCETARPFLPLLAKESLKSNILTPITSHIDKCTECSNDLMTIQELELPEDKLDNLHSIFLSHDFDFDSASDDEKLDLFVNLQWKHLSETDLKFYTCSLDCAEKISDTRDQLIEKLKKEDSEDNFDCKSIKAKHLFDLCFPVNFDSTTDPYEICQTSLAKHVAKCPKCLFKVQVLHHLIYDIRFRSNSDIITRFEFNTNDAGASAAGIHLPELENQKLKTSNIKYKSVTNLKRFAKIAAAAMILISLSLFITNIDTAQGLSLEQLYDKISNVRNVRILKFAAEINEPVEEKIISKDLNIYYVKQADKISIWNLNEQVLLTIQSGKKDLSTLDQSQVEKIQSLSSGTLGLLPFESVHNIPKNTKWKKLGNNTYQLDWFSIDASGLKVEYKWQVLIGESNLPGKVEWFIKKDKGLEKRFTLQITYPTASEIKALINDGNYF